MYLFNRPLVDLIEENWFGPNRFPFRLYGSSIPGQIAFTLAILAITTIMALLSWHLFEKHFLKLKKYFPQKELPAVELEVKQAPASNLSIEPATARRA